MAKIYCWANVIGQTLLLQDYVEPTFGCPDKITLDQRWKMLEDNVGPRYAWLLTGLNLWIDVWFLIFFYFLLDCRVIWMYFIWFIDVTMTEVVLKDGFAVKKSGQKNLFGQYHWQKRWFILIQKGSSVTLSYYEWVLFYCFGVSAVGLNWIGFFRIETS